MELFKLTNEELQMVSKLAVIFGNKTPFEIVKMNFVDIIDDLIKKVELLNMSKSVNKLCDEAYETAKSKGWHDSEREMGTLLMLIVGEVSEAMEADRRNEGQHRVIEELADVCIRIFDLCGKNGWDLEGIIYKKMEFNKGRSYKHGNKKY